MSSRDNNYALQFILFFLIITGISVESVHVRVENKGAYIARVLVRYQNSEGEEQLRNSGTFTAFRSSIVGIEEDAKSIEIEVQFYAFISSLRPIFKTNNQCPQTRCFVIWGTVFKAEWSEICCQ